MRGLSWTTASISAAGRSRKFEKRAESGGISGILLSVEKRAENAGISGILRRNPEGVEAARELPHLPGDRQKQPGAANVRLRNRMSGWFSRPSDLSDTKKPPSDRIPPRAYPFGYSQEDFLRILKLFRTSLRKWQKRHAWSCARL